MKKAYTKPSIYVENFTLMEHVAYGCDSQNFVKPDDTLINSRDKSCQYDMGDFILFENSSCDLTPGEVGGDRGCYEGTLFVGGVTFFLS